ncbi:protein-glutamate O-methyltransferase CheR [Thiomicrorhabdus sp. 6S2-11]|jgi:chemotaxis protein methyltransferase CheR|uniref:Chemotaxis protein methyltransferase n=1 Tax=Thiomicrorhabdus marina TaxID=2818442 RepID=A0ABS3Q715_9GAMM|nr:protein-glutamate O-methyltransferase CheR [Thiomicrorhabdus marina]MBO1928122.1 protein-glutamate O-methyltransferase CheR [Thiomicrorhabdus marina]
MDEREFLFTDKDFAHIKRIVYDFAGIDLNDSKKNLVYNRLAKRIRFLEKQSFSEYIKYVEQQGEQEFVHLINAITTNLTFFFRENHHFEYLAETVIPNLLQKNQASRKIRIWSAGCSTGEEPYSLAIVLKESVPAGWDAKVIATDLDSNVVATGQSGVYKLDRLKGMSLERKKRWFMKGTGAREGYAKVKPELQGIIEFGQLNLMADWPIKDSIDVIFCRNVVIYFDKQTQARLFDRYANLLQPEGHLFVGHSESLYNVCDRFELLGKTIYRKIR